MIESSNFFQKFPNFLIDAMGSVLLHPMWRFGNQAKSEVLHPSVIVRRRRRKYKKKILKKLSFEGVCIATPLTISHSLFF